MLACMNGHAEVVKISVSAGAHVNDDLYIFFTLVWVSFDVGCVLYIVDCYNYICIHYVNTLD